MIHHLVTNIFVKPLQIVGAFLFHLVMIDVRNIRDPKKVVISKGQKQKEMVSRKLMTIQYNIDKIETAYKDFQIENYDLLIDLYTKRRELQDIYFKLL